MIDRSGRLPASEQASGWRQRRAAAHWRPAVRPRFGEQGFGCWSLVNESAHILGMICANSHLHNPTTLWFEMWSSYSSIKNRVYSEGHIRFRTPMLVAFAVPVECVKVLCIDLVNDNDTAPSKSSDSANRAFAS
jgi:hypothetical protein